MKKLAILFTLVSIFASCKKDTIDSNIVELKVSCDSCTVQYYMNKNVSSERVYLSFRKVYNYVEGFDPTIKVYNNSTTNPVKADIFIGGELMVSNTGNANNSVVMATYKMAK